MESKQTEDRTTETENPREDEKSKKSNPACLVGAIIMLCCAIALFLGSLWFTLHFILGWI